MSKHEFRYLLKKLQALDMNIIRAFAVKTVEENEARYAYQLLQSKEGAMAGLNG